MLVAEVLKSHRAYFCQVRRSAKKRGIPFKLTEAQSLALWEKQERRCALTGDRIGFGDGSKAASLDRINSSKGYSLTNCQYTTQSANCAKQSMTNSEFVKFCWRVSTYRGV